MSLPRLALLVLLAAGCSGCGTVMKTADALSTDRIAARLGLPPRGFATDAVFPDGVSPPPPPSPVAASMSAASMPAPPSVCAGHSCNAEEGFCAARGYVPDTDGFARCVTSVLEHEASIRH